MKRLIGAAMVGVGMALLPLVALAEGATEAAGAVAEGRGLAPPADFGMTLLATVGALTALFVITTLGYLYRQERHLDWPFQAAAVPHDEHSAAH